MPATTKKIGTSKKKDISKKNQTTKVSGALKKPMENPLQFQIPSALSKVQQNANPFKGNQGHLYVLGREDKGRLQNLIDTLALPFQKDQLKKSSRELLQFLSDQGPVWVLAPKKKSALVSHHGRLEESSYAWMRDQMGTLVSFFKAYHLDGLHIELHATDEEQEMGLFTGLEMAVYNYRNVIEKQSFQDFPQVSFRKIGSPFSQSILKQARALGEAVNLARHLVNTPPNFLNPTTFSQFAVSHFSRAKGMKVTIWDEKRLAREGMNLHLGVGQGSPNPPCLVHLRYRPLKATRKKPIAIVGKGVTFDTGGVDIKPSSGMRMMKKDMGGAAAVMGVAQWAVETGYSRPLDLYLALAENSVDGKSFRPSDVLTARNGLKVEIHNTDAEGRLVLADALDVAVTQKGEDEPEMIIDVATLTGAIKVALGSEIAGLFTNYDDLGEDLNWAGQKAGDLNWRMPLYSRYTSNMSSAFADVVNAVDGFGGAITAALFLEKFVRQKPWAHLDIYGWNDKAGGALTFAGGSGQSVQALVQFLTEKA